MRKQNCCCPDNQMCCPCKGYQNDFAPVIRSPSYKESSSTQDECLPCKCKNNPSKYKGAINESVDRHAKNGSSSK